MSASEPTAGAPETARERQVREAEAIARRNPEWKVTTSEKHIAIRPANGRWHPAVTCYGTHRWYAFDGRGRPLKAAQMRVPRWFRSPAAAIRALGFTITEGEEDA